MSENIQRIADETIYTIMSTMEYIDAFKRVLDFCLVRDRTPLAKPFILSFMRGIDRRSRRLNDVVRYLEHVYRNPLRSDAAMLEPLKTVQDVVRFYRSLAAMLDDFECAYAARDIASTILENIRKVTKALRELQGAYLSALIEEYVRAIMFDGNLEAFMRRELCG